MGKKYILLLIKEVLLYKKHLCLQTCPIIYHDYRKRATWVFLKAITPLSLLFGDNVTEIADNVDYITNVSHCLSCEKTCNMDILVKLLEVVIQYMLLFCCYWIF
jgi:L-lactate utilization protein LutB